MAIARVKTSSILQGFPKSRSLLAGNTGYVPGPTAGYVAQGTSNINKFEFTSDTKTTTSVALSGATAAVGWANGTVAGYFGAEYGTSTGLIDKYDSATFSKTTISATMGFATEGWGACSNDGTAAYWTGGYDNIEAGGAPKNLYKLLYSNDTRSVLASGIGGYNYRAGCSSAKTAGYINEGGSGVGQSYSIQKITFSTDALSTVSSVLTASYARAAFANGTTAGYWAGGEPSRVSSINKVTFSSDTGSTLSATLSTGRQGASGYSNSGTAGYIAGGYDSAAISGIDKITYASDTKSTLSATLSAGRNFPGAFAL
jgi:hypothetical protein